jgi:hypothetical protein
MNCDCAGKFFSTVVHCWCDPCYEALALLFTKIYVNISQDAQVFREKTYAGINELVVDRKVPDHLLQNKQNQGHVTDHRILQNKQSQGHMTDHRLLQNKQYEGQVTYPGINDLVVDRKVPDHLMQNKKNEGQTHL